MGMSEKDLKALQGADPNAALSILMSALGGASGGAALADDPYEQARTEFATVPTRKPSGTEKAISSIRGLAAFRPAEGFQTENTGAEKPFLESATGKIMYPNGAIYDPATRQTLYPTSFKQAADIPGSDAWLRKIQDEWGDDKVAKWRKDLADWGYGIAPEGGVDAKFLEALQTYHNLRYSNGGKPLPMDSSATTEADMPDIRETFDKQALKEEVKGWGDVAFGEPLEDQEAEWFSDRVLKVAQRLARKHGDSWTATDIQEGAKLRVQKEFVQTPGAADALEEAEELEGDTTLRNSIVSVSQLGAI